MLPALVISGKDRAGQKHALGGLGLHRPLAFECGQACGFTVGLGAFLLLQGFKAGQGLAAGGISRGSLALSLFGAQAGLALGRIAFGAQAGQFLTGTLGFGLGSTAHGLGFGLLGAQLGQHPRGFLRLQAGLLGREPVGFRLGLGALAILRLAPGKISPFGFGPLGSKGIFRSGAVGAIAKNRGNQEQDSKDGYDNVLVHVRR